MQNKRFSQVLKEEIEKPAPSREGIISLQDRLRRFANNVRRKLGWQPSDNIAIDFKQQQEDAINDVIIALMRKYREKLMSSHVTERATSAVLTQVRGWVRRQYAELNRTELVSDEEVEKFSPAVFYASAEDKVEDFERLHTLGVIDVVEFYFLFAAYHGETTAYASQLIQIQEARGRKILQRARERVQSYLEDLETSELPTPKVIQEKPSSRDIDMDLLMSAIRQVLGRSF